MTRLEGLPPLTLTWRRRQQNPSQSAQHIESSPRPAQEIMSIFGYYYHGPIGRGGWLSVRARTGLDPIDRLNSVAIGSAVSNFEQL
jgi:hypothetical protein